MYKGIIFRFIVQINIAEWGDFLEVMTIKAVKLR